MHKKGMMVKCVFFSSFSANIPRARRELLNFYSFSTPLAKMACVKRVILSLMQSPRNAEGLSAFQYINKVDNTYIYIIALAGCLGRVGWLPPNSPDRLPRLHMYDEMKYRLCASNVSWRIAATTVHGIAIRPNKNSTGTQTKSQILPDCRCCVL